jgi:hypothetical protein
MSETGLWDTNLTDAQKSFVHMAVLFAEADSMLEKHRGPGHHGPITTWAKVDHMLEDRREMNLSLMREAFVKMPRWEKLGRGIVSEA